MKDWWGAAKADAKPAAAPTATAAAAVAVANAKIPAKPESIAAAPGGGAGMVWVNESSKVYHCQGDKWYGKTKHGEYVKEGDVKAKGMKAAGSKACAA